MDCWSPSLIRTATSEGMILLRGTSSEIAEAESFRTTGTDSIPAAEQVGGEADAGATSAPTRVNGEAFSSPINNHQVAAKHHATKQQRPRSITFLSDRIAPDTDHSRPVRG